MRILAGGSWQDCVILSGCDFGFSATESVLIDRFAIACTGLWRGLFTRACFLIGQSRKQGD
jgi:hypothetical protein